MGGDHRIGISLRESKMTLYKWSQTASADALADSTINWAEGQSPSSVNDSARAMMAAIAKYRDDNGGTLITAGTPTAYTLTSNQAFDSFAHMHFQSLTFFMHTTNGANPTLNVDGLGAIPLVTDVGTAIPTGSLVAGSPYEAVYFNSASQWRMKNFYVNPYNIPVGGGMLYFGTTVPNSNFAFPNGQFISRTTYATLFALLGNGNIYGTGDGLTTFALPDLTGRVPAMKEAAVGGSRLTSATVGLDGSVLGGSTLGGNGLVQANLPSANFSLTGTASVASSSGDIVKSTGALQSTTAGGGTPSITLPAGLTSIGNVTATGPIGGFAASGGSSTTVRMVQPTLITNYIMRII
jgi:microcystin-dependent protein